MPTFFKLQSFFSLSLYQLIESQKVIQMEGQQEDNQTRNNLQQQAGMQEFAKKKLVVRKCYCTVSSLVNILTNLYIFRVHFQYC